MSPRSLGGPRRGAAGSTSAETAVFSSWHGRYSDSPRAVSQELARVRPDVRQVWLSDPEGPAPDPSVQRVPIGGAEEIAALEEARWIITNDVLPMAFRKRPDAVYLQTWHGTPLKRIAFDVVNPSFPDADYHYAVELVREVQRWDMLLSPNPYSTDLLRGAFRYDGPVLETGLPRNDVLFAPDAEERRRALRRTYGIRDDPLAVLYAPTWRDDFTMRVALDVAAIRAAMGDRVVVLVRAHGLTAARTQVDEAPGSIDVTRWPDISDLYLAADVLVTDYSSAMVDFAITGKPQLFYTYDLEDYRDRIRGFYVDLESLVPGPLLSTTAEVIAALRDLEGVAREHRDAYAAFVERFCSLDDGAASARVVEALLEPPYSGASAASRSAGA